MRNHKFSESGRRVLELVELVRVLLDHKAYINARDPDSSPRWTALHCAVCYNMVEIVGLLLQYQAQVDARDHAGRTPLFYAKNVEVARLLIAHGTDVNSKDVFGHPIWLSVMQKHCDLETLKALVEHGVDLHGEDGIRALHQAATNVTLEIMEFLLDQGVHVNGKAEAKADGGTPLHYAVRRGWVRGVQLLLQRGADVNATDLHCKTPLAYLTPFHEADGAEEVAELLVEHIVAEGTNVLALGDLPPELCRRMVEKIVRHPKVDLNARVSADGETLAFDMIDKLCQKLDVYRPILMLLIEYGADIKAKHRQSGRTLLHFAAAGYKSMVSSYNRVEFISEVQLLLEKGADVNSIDNNGFTPLLYAIYHGHWNIVPVLVDHGADVSISHRDYISPLLMACKMNKESTVQLLLGAGAKVDDDRLRDGATALLVCVRKSLVGCASLLLNRGADIHAANRKGCTPFLEACKQGRLDMIYCLIRSSSHHGRLGLLSEVSYIHHLCGQRRSRK